MVAINRFFSYRLPLVPHISHPQASLRLRFTPADRHEELNFEVCLLLLTVIARLGVEGAGQAVAIPVMVNEMVYQVDAFA